MSLMISINTLVTDVIQTDVPHIFDVPGAENVVHEVFFRTFGDNSTLPQITITAEVDTNKFYYVRFVTPKTFAGLTPRQSSCWFT